MKRARVITPRARLLRDVREEHDLSLAQVAQATGIPRPNLSQIENGLRNPTVRERYLIGAVLGIDARRLNIRAYLVVEDAA